jgi:outer membrane protein OmpA-like peptidoglycan-associated protein
VGIAPEVSENNDRVLRRIAEILNRFGEYSIVIEGHANPTTPPGTARRQEEETGSARVLGLRPLSEARAGTVLEYLVELGVRRDRLSFVGMGGSRTLVAFEDTAYWWQNRRVEFILQR